MAYPSDWVTGEEISAARLKQWTDAIKTFGNEGIYAQITNPTLLTPDFSFASSYKGVTVDVVFDSGAPQIGHAIQGQFDVQATAPAGGASIGVEGCGRVSRASEVYGIFGYVDWEHTGAVGSGLLAATRGTMGGVWLNRHGIISVAEADEPCDSGLSVTSSQTDNKFHYGVRVVSSIDAAFRGTVDASGIGMYIENLAPSAGSADPQTGILLDRSYGDVGDSMDIVFGSGGGMGGARAGRLSMLATSGGQTGFVFYAQHGASDGYSAEILRVRGDANIIIPNASAAPSGETPSGGILWVESGSLRYKGGAGTVTILAPA